MSIYFIIIEFVQSIRSRNFFESYINIENVFDLLPNALILFNCFYIDKLNIENDGENSHKSTFWKI